MLAHLPLTVLLLALPAGADRSSLGSVERYTRDNIVSERLVQEQPAPPEAPRYVGPQWGHTVPYERGGNFANSIKWIISY